MRSVVVLQADGRRHPGGVRAPLAVGVWRAGTKRMAFTVKTCLSLETDRAVFVTPTPFAPPRRYELDPTLHAAPHDWMPPQPEAFFYVVGHAHAHPSPSTRIDASVSLNDWRLHFAAVTAKPALEVPLVGEHVRVAAGPLRLAPREDHAPPPELRVPAWPRGATLKLEGLSPRAAHREIALPASLPRLFVERGVEDHFALPLHCDAAVLDTDHETLTQWWRAAVPLRDHHCDRVVVALDAETSSFGHLSRDVPRGTVGFAAEPVPLPRDDDELEMARHEALVFSAEPELEVATFAAIAFELSAARRPRPEILAQHDLDERAWTIEERAWTERLAQDADHGDGAELERYAAVMTELQAEHQAPEMSDDELEALRRRIRDGEAPHGVLSEAGLTPADWLILQGR